MVMHKMALIILVAVMGSLTLQAKDYPYEKTVQKWETEVAKKPVPENAVLFLGSSSIRMWHKRLNKDFPGLTLIKRGFGGSQIKHVVHFMDRIVIPYKPSKIVLYCGENDIAGKSTPESVYENWKKFADHVHAKLPETKIWYVAMKPSIQRWKMWEKMDKGNKMIEKDCETRDYATYIPIEKHMLGEDGKPLPDIWLKDKLHMNGKGYEIWTKVIGEAIGYKKP